MWRLFKKGDRDSGKKSEEKAGIDRRRMERIDMILTINCSVPGEIDALRIMTENVNALGGKFISPVELKKDQIIHMKILLKSHFPTLNIKGRIVWCKAIEKDGRPCFEGGIEFLPYSEEEMSFFQKFIDQRSTHEEGPEV